MKTPRLRRRSRTTDTEPVRPVSVPEQVPAPMPVQDEPQPRTSRRTARTARRTAERAAKTDARTTRRATRTEQKAYELGRKRAAKAEKRAPSNARKLRARLERKLREKASEPAMTPDARAGLMGVSRRGALVAITLLDLAATAVSFGESWDALYQWATKHGLSGFWAFMFPFQIDTFIAMGELALFIAIIDHWHWRSRIWAWVSTFGGLAVSMVGNVGHVSSHPGSWQATAAVPPLAAMAGMFIGFQVLKRVMNPTKAATLDQEHLDIISQLRHQVDELSRPAAPEPTHVPAQRPASEPGQFYTGDRLDAATSFQAPAGMPNMGTYADDPEPVRLAPGMVSRAANQVVGPDGTHPAQLISEPYSYLEDVEKEGQQTPPTPRTSMGQDRPEIVKEPPAAKPAPAPRRKRGGKHPRWDEAVKRYKESGDIKVERFSQRELAAALGMQNRQLAARVIDAVENGGE